MPEISRCNGEDCPLRNDCYRFRVIGSKDLQSYISSPYRDGGCSYFMEIQDGDRLNPIGNHVEK